ncbi:unnamed protein product [marine sediment metagenome]|uniref:Tyrosine--tRNA ligase n=1 Tax=marine sediment metagenome TaxID=412755 RepID=X0Z034_9ZZZZ
MNNEMWSTPKEIEQILISESKKKAVLFYEFAPTGKLHAGILRTLIRMNDVLEYLDSMDINTTSILSIADQVALKEQNHFPNFNQFKNRQLNKIPNPITGKGSYSDYFLDDIKKTIKYFKIKIDRYENVSKYYSKKMLYSFVPLIYKKQDEIIFILSKYQKSRPALFHPKCEKCGLLYQGTIYRINSLGCSDFKCTNCGYSSLISIINNVGIFPFKLETAIKWKLLNVDVQFVGIDHKDAIKASIELYENLFGKCNIIPYFLNLTISEGNEVVRKSLGNYKPVTTFNEQERQELRELLKKTKDGLLLRLPQKFRITKKSQNTL